MSILALEHQFSSVTTKKSQFTNLACMKQGKEYVCVMPLSTQHLLYGDFKSQIKYPQKNSENLRLLKTRSEPAILVFSRNSCSDIGCYGNKNANENSMYFFMLLINLKFILRMIHFVDAYFSHHQYNLRYFRYSENWVPQTVGWDSSIDVSVSIMQLLLLDIPRICV